MNDINIKYLCGAFKDAFCWAFCNKTEKGKCNGCPAMQIHPDTWDKITLKNLLQPKKKGQKGKKKK